MEGTVEDDKGGDEDGEQVEGVRKWFEVESRHGMMKQKRMQSAHAHAYPRHFLLPCTAAAVV